MRPQSHRKAAADLRDTPKSGKGQPHSKTLARFYERCFFRKVSKSSSDASQRG
jgi:hypothetical protein